tara:strand:+ start:499 stop:753 length:255 start_codon:yes stop_codon:yes gene_type:complete
MVMGRCLAQGQAVHVDCHRSFHPAFDDDVPYAIVVIEMDEGVRVVSQIVDAEPDALKLSDAVEVVFVPVANGKVLPKFKLAPGS